MSILYDFYATPSSEGTEQSTPNYHARVVNRQTVDADILISHICERSSLGKGDVLAMFNEMSFEIGQQLLAGNRVYIPEIGYFSLSLQTPAHTNPDATHAQQIKVKRIEFRAEAKLRNKIIKEATFERSLIKRHSAKLTNEEVDKLVREYLGTHSFMTRASFSELCHFTRGTAQKHIRRLIDEGIIVNTNTPYQPIYVLEELQDGEDA